MVGACVCSIEDYDGRIERARLELDRLFRIEDYPTGESLPAGAISHVPTTTSRSPPSASVPQHGKSPHGTNSPDSEIRRRNLPLVVNNAKALPWVPKTLPTLVLVERRLPDDWEGVLCPVETFCESSRFEGTCSANWTRVGRAHERSRRDLAAFVPPSNFMSAAAASTPRCRSFGLPPTMQPPHAWPGYLTITSAT